MIRSFTSLRMTACRRRALSGLILACGLMISALAQALSYVGYRIEADESDTVYQSVDLLLDTGRDWSVTGGIGRTEFGGEPELTADEFKLGIDSDLGARSGFGLYYDFWGQQAQVELHTLRVSGFLDAGPVRLRVEPELRSVNLNTSVATLLDRRVPPQIDTQRSGVGVLISSRLDGPWWFDGEYYQYWYDDDPQRFASAPRIVAAIFSPIVITAVSAFEDRHFTAKVDYAGQHWRLGVSWDYSVSAVDHSSVHYLTGDGSYSLRPQWEIGAKLGVYDPGSELDSWYAGAGLTYYW